MAGLLPATVERINCELKPVKEPALRHNAAVVQYCRTLVAALSGSTAGVLGLTGIYGFAFFFLSSAILSYFLLMKASPGWKRFFLSKTSLVWTGVLGTMFTYVLFWTFLYGVVHIY